MSTDAPMSDRVQMVAATLMVQHEREHDHHGLSWRDFEDKAREVLAALDDEDD